MILRGCSKRRKNECNTVIFLKDYTHTRTNERGRNEMREKVEERKLERERG